MNLTFSGLFSSLVFGVIGLWLFREGKRRINNRVMWVGLLLMIVPNFTSGVLADWGCGLALCGLAYYWW